MPHYTTPEAITEHMPAVLNGKKHYGWVTDSDYGIKRIAEVAMGLSCLGAPYDEFVRVGFDIVCAQTRKHRRLVALFVDKKWLTRQLVVNFGRVIGGDPQPDQDIFIITENPILLSNAVGAMATGELTIIKMDGPDAAKAPEGPPHG